MTPSQRQFGDTRLVLRTIDMQQFYNAFPPTIADRRVPDISPLYADLKGLCPALFSVGTKDAVLDDSLFMHTRWGRCRKRGRTGDLPRLSAWLHAVPERSVEGGDSEDGCLP
jgi:acetyl esterase